MPIPMLTSVERTGTVLAPRPVSTAMPIPIAAVVGTGADASSGARRAGRRDRWATTSARACPAAATTWSTTTVSRTTSIPTIR